jgi:N-acetylmuramoyl-L-alanine amidase CwlA
MQVVKPAIQWVQANSNNYSIGRVKPIRVITFHHIVGSDDSAIAKFQNPSAATSAHFVVGDDRITQMVPLVDTAWTNANWLSNSEAITIEHEGDWRNGYRNEAVIKNSAQLVAWIRSQYPDITFNRHRDVATTACPADLPVEEIWDRATVILQTPDEPPVAPATPIQITDIQNRIVVTNKNANLWDLNFNTWAEARAVKVIPAGTEVEVSAVAKHPLGGSYYLTEYSFSKGIKNGINIVDCSEKPAPPVVEPPIVVPPVPTPVPSPPTEYDKTQDAQISAIQKQLDALKDLVNRIIAWITGWSK